MNEIALDKSTLDLIISVLKGYSDIQYVKLFGSRAKNTARANSDIDLAIFGVSERLQIEQIKENLELLPLLYTFDVIAFESIHNPALKEHIERVGVVIYENTPPLTYT